MIINSTIVKAATSAKILEEINVKAKPADLPEAAAAAPAEEEKAE